MASDQAFRYFKYAEQQAFLRWRKLHVHRRQEELLELLTDVDMPPWKKRCIIRDVIYYPGSSDCRPLTGLGVYDYPMEVVRLPDTASYDFSLPTASSSAEDSTPGPTETAMNFTEVESSQAESVNKVAQHSTTLQSSKEVESSLAKSSNESGQKSTSTGSSEQVESSPVESVNESTRKSSILGSSEEAKSWIAQTVDEAVRQSTVLQSSKETESSLGNTVNESAQKSISLRHSEQVESSPVESVNESAEKSITLGYSEEAKSSLAQPRHTVNELTQKSTSLLAEPAVNHKAHEYTNTRTSELVDTSLVESEFDTIEEWTTSEQNTPEWSRRSDSSNLEMLLSPALSALKINQDDDLQDSEVENSIKDFAKSPNVPFFKCGKLCKHLGCTLTSIGDGRISNEVNTLEPLDRAESDSSPMLLVPSNIRPEVQQLVQQFAEQFNYRIMGCDAIAGSFDERVTHVLADLELPDSLQFAQYQAIGCRRYLISTDWLLASLEARRILPEDSFEVIFYEEETGKSVASPSRVARTVPKKLFDGFAIVMCRPFVVFEETQMVRLLIMNGAHVCRHPRQLINFPDQARVCIVDSICYRKKPNKLLKRKSHQYKFVVVHYQWLFDCFLMYPMVQSLLPYLHDAGAEDALAAGVPVELLD